jgi:hypothetical protein
MGLLCSIAVRHVTARPTILQSARWLWDQVTCKKVDGAEDERRCDESQDDCWSAWSCKLVVSYVDQFVDLLKMDVFIRYLRLHSFVK